MTETLDTLLYVEWHDAVTSSDGWASSNDPHTLHLCKSVGWLIKETRKELILAADTSEPQDEQDGCDVNRRIAIPKAWVKLRRKLKIPVK